MVENLQSLPMLTALNSEGDRLRADGHAGPGGMGRLEDAG